MIASSSKPLKISLTSFTDFATKPPEQQLTVARKVVKQHVDGYNVPEDLYKGFREGLQTMYREGFDLGYLKQICDGQTQSGRSKHYPELLKGFRKFLGRKQIEALVANQGDWVCNGLAVSVRPEIALRINRTPHLIKLWFNCGNSINKRRAQLINQLMHESIPACEEGLVPAVLDVRKGKLFASEGTSVDSSAILQTQAAAFVSLYTHERNQYAARAVAHAAN